MEKKLYDACLKGDVQKLEALMREDELTLARISLSACFNQTPLHLACMLGHFEFAKSLLSYKPDFATRLDSQGRSPLHLASANGYANIVQLLLQHDRTVCQLCDEDGRTPLQLAVMNGQHESVRELIKVESCNQELGQALHLCVMYNRLNVLDVILESRDTELLNFKDDKGNTILHCATTLRRMHIITYLVMSRSKGLKVNAVNENGLTALNIVEQMPKDVKIMEIKELLVSAGTLKAEELKQADQYIQAGEAEETDSNSKCVKMWEKIADFTIFQEKQEKRDESLLVAASVIAAMAYTAAISPPGGVASMDAKEYPNVGSPDYSHYDIPKLTYNPFPAASLLSYFNPKLSYTFWISNHIAFMASLSVIFLYVSGATLRRRFFTWLIRAAMWITLTAMTIAYVCAVTATTGSTDDYSPLYPLLFGLLAWGILVFVSFVVLVYRFHRYLKNNPAGMMKKKTSEDSTATSTSTSTFKSYINV